MIMVRSKAEVDTPQGLFGLVWDLDGVIVDSAEAHNASWEAMAREFGVPYDPDRDFKAIFGMHNTDIINSLWSITDPSRIEEMAASKENSFRRAAAELRPLPGVLELLQELKAKGWKQAIGSSAPLANIELLLRAVGVAEYIDAVASGDDVSRGKPDPEVFLLAFRRMGVDPRNGVVIEDAPAGVEAGVRSGAVSVGVTTSQPRETLERAGAQFVVGTLEEINASLLEELVRRGPAAKAAGNKNKARLRGLRYG
jgi:HAD superfamily hydrolase (TIGR01509 family)